MEHEIQRHLRRNFIANMGDGTLWLFGFSFLSSATILPVYFAHLSSSTLLLGLIPALLDLGWFLPQLFIAPRVERLARKKPWVLALGIGERLPFCSWRPGRCGWRSCLRRRPWRSFLSSSPSARWRAAWSPRPGRK